MATARRKTASTAGAAAKADSGPWAGALRFDVYEENSGRHRWRLRTSDVAKLAHDVARSRPSLVRRRQRWRPEFSS